MSEPSISEIVYWNTRLELEKEYHETRMARLRDPDRIAELEAQIALISAIIHESKHADIDKLEQIEYALESKDG